MLNEDHTIKQFCVGENKFVILQEKLFWIHLILQNSYDGVRRKRKMGNSWCYEMNSKENDGGLYT